MEVILLERVGRLGHMGEVVRVKDGYARNYLLPRGKALRATEANRAKFDGMKADLEARNKEAKGVAVTAGEKIADCTVTVLRQAAETGQLFGSVSSRDLMSLLAEQGVKVTRDQILLDHPIKTIGKHAVTIALHPEVEVIVGVIVARNAEEAERVARGEDVTQRREARDEAAEALAAAEEFFEPEALKDEADEDAEANASDDAKAGKKAKES